MEPKHPGSDAAEAVPLPKIFVFCNGCLPGWHSFAAIAEDGAVLAGHVCSDHGWAHHDMGVNEDGWKRDLYAAHYPNGFEVEYVEVYSKADVAAHAGLTAALDALNADETTADTTATVKCSGCQFNTATRRDADDVADVCDYCGEASDDQKRDREKRLRRMAEREEI